MDSKNKPNQPESWLSFLYLKSFYLIIIHLACRDELQQGHGMSDLGSKTTPNGPDFQTKTRLKLEFWFLKLREEIS